MRTETLIRVFLPAWLESHDKLEAILLACHDNGAIETSSIGPTALYVNTTAQNSVIRTQIAIDSILSTKN